MRFHRIQIRPSGERVVVRAGGETIAESMRSLILSEGRIPERVYLPFEDVHDGALAPTETSTHCPFKGDASYWSLSAGGRTYEDAAFSYLEPLDGVAQIAGLVCFLHDDVEVELVAES